MKPHLTSASTTLTMYSDNKDATAEALAHPLALGDRAGRAQEVRVRPRLTLATAPVWMHKLILKGKLDHRTVVELEDEIECLCEEGVTILTLDLRQLDAIDSVGARAIASGGVTCRQRGRDFVVVPGSPVIHRALTEAGAEGLLAGDPSETGARPIATSTSDEPPSATSTAMVKNL
jgi:anti-anti-sigma factor